MRCTVLAIGCASLFLSGCDESVYGDWSQAREDFHYSYPLKAGGRLEVENQNGPVDISGWDGNTVEIDGTKYAADPDLLKQIRVDIAPSSSAVSIRTVRPEFSWRSGSVRYKIRVPHGVELARIETSNGPIHLDAIDAPAYVHTSNGPVRANGVRGSLDITTSNGPINVTDAGGAATLHTSNGPIDLSLDAIAEVHAGTSNGPITLRIPSGSGAELRAHTSHGPVTTDFNLPAQDRFHREVEGRIGSGGPVLELSTSNGPIKVLRR